MSKKHAKQRAPVRTGVGLSSLRPRLDQLLRSGVNDPEQKVAHELDALTDGLKPTSYLPIVLAAAIDGPSEAQVLLNRSMPGWLSQHGRLDALRDLLARHTLDEEKARRALAWLAEAGADTSDLRAEAEEWNPFFDAYLAGNEMQATLTIFWYDDRRRNRVHSLGLLLDYEPPWNGAVKDALHYPKRTPDDAIAQFIRLWREQSDFINRLTAEEAKRKAVEAMEHNRTSNIRLPPDLLLERSVVLRELLTLPDGPHTPPVTAEDFEYLASQGENPEAIRRRERMFGYRTRTADGREIIVLPGPDDF